MRIDRVRSSGNTRYAAPACFARRASVSAFVAMTSIGKKLSRASIASKATTFASGSRAHAAGASGGRLRPLRRIHDSAAVSTGAG